MADKKTTKKLFEIKELARTSDGKSAIYCGYLGKVAIGEVSAKNATLARKKLAAMARKLIK